MNIKKHNTNTDIETYFKTYLETQMRIKETKWLLHYDTNNQYRVVDTQLNVPPRKAYLVTGAWWTPTIHGYALIKNNDSIAFVEAIIPIDADPDIYIEMQMRITEAEWLLGHDI